MTYIRSFFTIVSAAAILLIILPGCAIRSVYVPLAHNVPLFDSNRHVVASAYLGTNHVELQAAANPVKKLAVATNIYFGTGISVYDGALGIYNYSRNLKWRYEVFGGYGYSSNTSYKNGNILSSSQKISYDVSSIYHRLYIQPALGFTGHINIYKIDYSFSLSAKVSYLHFQDYLFRQRDEALSTPAAPVYIVNTEYHNKNMFLFEPCITNKVGIRNIYAILQVQTISPWSQQIDVRYTKFSPVIYFSGGIQYTFTFKHRK